jgi:cytochrome c553
MRFLPLIAALLFTAHTAVGEITPEQAEFFETRIRPVLADQCYRCHSNEAEKLKAGLHLDSRAGLIEGGESGPALVPGDVDKSLIIEALHYQNADMQMPPKKKLSPEVIADFEKWVTTSAPWPGGDKAPAPPEAKEGFDLEKRRSEHWVWQPIVPHPGKSPDEFILEKLNIEGLSPAPPADRRTLIRRATFDLIGLPPTPAEVADFLSDSQPDDAAFVKVVDRLLASPHFGERWARHWMDLVRFGESCGHEFDFPLAHAWRYRDYLIRALNADIPYNNFVAEHIAGDLLPNPRRHPVDGFNESVIATGFWFFGEAIHAPTDVRGDEALRVDNQIDVMSKTFLGVTVACARCHDHKFDAISTKDYYALAGYLQSSRREEAILDPKRKIETISSQLRKLKEEGDRQIGNRLKPTQSQGGDNMVKFADFNDGSPQGWTKSGEAWTSAPTKDSEWDSTRKDGAAVEPGIMHSGLTSPKLQGSLRSPTFKITHEKIFYKVKARKGNIRFRLVVDSYRMSDFQQLLFGGTYFGDVDTMEQWQWLTGAGDVNKYIGHNAYIEVLDEGDGFIALDEVWFGNGAPPTGDLNSLPPGNADRFTSISKKMDELTATLPNPIRIHGMTDGTAENEFVFLRGSHKKLGDEVPRHFLTALGGKDIAPPKEGSGRLDLAKQIVDPKNPLVARVIVNRLWHHLFGKGIVPTPNDFGYLGQAPTHPELLDALAAEFVRDGWSIKRAIRRMMLTKTYRMSSDANPEAAAKDPNNTLLQRANIRRLEGEAIRDQLLLVSGRLDRKLYGGSVPVHVTSFMTGRGAPGSGPLDGDGRRSIYTKVQRNFLSPMMLAFDTPIPASSIGRRSISNVPAQALILMNDPFVIQQAELWAQKVMKEQATPEARITAMYESAFSRPPTPQEITHGKAFVIQDDLASWKDYAHVLINTKEFVFLR